MTPISALDSHISPRADTGILSWYGCLWFIQGMIWKLPYTNLYISFHLDKKFHQPGLNGPAHESLVLIACVQLPLINAHADVSSGARDIILIRPRGYRTFLCSTQLSMKFILLINVKMPTVVAILTFISRKNTSYESLKARKTYLFQHFSFYEQLKLCSVEKFYNLGPRAFLNFYTLCMQEAKALNWPCVCAGSSEPSLLANRISTKS